MRLHQTEVDLSRHARPRLSAKEERDPTERVAKIERTREVRGAGEATVVGSPVCQGNSKLFDAQRCFGVRKRAKRVGSTDESVGAGRRGRRQESADPLSKHRAPGRLGK